MGVKKVNTIELFAGCGGLMDGFLQQGAYDTLACVEWEKYPCQTIVKRLKDKWGHQNADEEVVRFDIQRSEELLNGIDDPEYGKHKGLDRLIDGRTIDVVVGGPPCQAYSLAGRIRDAKGMREDYRNYLFESYIKIVKHFKPKFFVFENVVGLLSAAPDGYPIVKRIYNSFMNAGYKVIGDFKKALFEVADYGVPQHRRRVIILGVRMDIFDKGDKKLTDEMLSDFYDNIMPSLRKQTRTVYDAIGNLPKIYPLQEPMKTSKGKFSHSPFSSDEVMNHVPRFHSKRDIGVFRLLAEDIKSGRKEYVSIEKLKELYTQVTGKKSNIHKYYVLRYDEPSNTIPAHLYKDGMRHIHPDPEQARSITVREAARLQTFPDDFEFLGPNMAQYKMIGNAVPVDFAKIVAQGLYKIIEKYN
ncbi:MULTISPECIES: DNA cytosine methyltransferase [Bacteroidaceae]|jgi:DNA (cytosine-5-)-methyltransferase|uniref:DNA cytosine methyltransferase n=1 Tax=Bacteroidaceae TaxID=815 RepID=UPI001D0F21F4|nr:MULTISPECIES: DNA cytosine methyltransferase [Bacteroidaceae]MCC2235588.1 DNA cytosine methyltransferase [Bacteroides hominis (ex Afrizal et al. 2022)]MCE9352043.1 DNA cytosine methyltransferase [Phocaeicola vulgatus]